MPTNFKTYEAQARLLAAVVAAHPELKLNYKGEFLPDPKFTSSGVPHWAPLMELRSPKR